MRSDQPSFTDVEYGNRRRVTRGGESSPSRHDDRYPTQINAHGSPLLHPLGTHRRPAHTPPTRTPPESAAWRSPREHSTAAASDASRARTRRVGRHPDRSSPCHRGRHVQQRPEHPTRRRVGLAYLRGTFVAHEDDTSQQTLRGSRARRTAHEHSARRTALPMHGAHNPSVAHPVRVPPTCPRTAEIDQQRPMLIGVNSAGLQANSSARTVPVPSRNE